MRVNLFRCVEACFNLNQSEFFSSLRLSAAVDAQNSRVQLFLPRVQTLPTVLILFARVDTWCVCPQSTRYTVEFRRRCWCASRVQKLTWKTRQRATQRVCAHRSVCGSQEAMLAGAIESSVIEFKREKHPTARASVLAAPRFAQTSRSPNYQANRMQAQRGYYIYVYIHRCTYYTERVLSQRYTLSLSPQERISRQLSPLHKAPTREIRRPIA